MDNSRKVVLDGRTGEGGGQLVRVAVALAALTGTPLRIDNVRGNRQGKRGGGELNSSSIHIKPN
jgi:RNA 3'-terminal phosphate cyclase (ATP)